MSDRTDLRLNYFNQQFLRADDFEQEQAYHMDRLRRHIRTSQTPGVTEGLTVKKDPASDTSVILEPGSAVDSDGRQIVQPKALRIPLTKYKNETILLALAYEEGNPDDPDYRVMVDGEPFYTRTREYPRLGITTTSRLSDSRWITLARIKVNGRGQPIDIDSGVRMQSTLRGLPKTDDSPVITDSVPGDFSVGGDLRVKGDVIYDGALRGALRQPGFWHAEDVTSDVQITESGTWQTVPGMHCEITLDGAATLHAQYVINVQTGRVPIDIQVVEQSTDTADESPEAAEEPVDEKSDSTPSYDYSTYTVTADDSGIDGIVYKLNLNSKAAGVKEVRQLIMRLNDKDTSTIRPGEKLLVPQNADDAAAMIEQYPDSKPPVTQADDEKAGDAYDGKAPETVKYADTGDYEIYTVTEADDRAQGLGGIVVRYGLAQGWTEIRQVVDLLMEINDLDNTVISPGQELKIPKEVTDVEPLGNDFLALRLVIDNKPVAASGTRCQPTLDIPPNTLLSGAASVPLPGGAHTVQLQWYKYGSALTHWQSATASAGAEAAEGFVSGRSLTVTAYYS